MTDSSPQLEIARLEARVAALEEALERRSRQLRSLQPHLCPRDLGLLVRVSSGLPVLPPRQAFSPELWPETTDLISLGVEETLLDLWTSLAPIDPAPDEP